MSEQYTEPIYIGYVYLPNSRCRVRFLPMDGKEQAEEETKPRDDVPLWGFSLVLVVIAVLIGLCGSFLLLPYGGLCR